VELDSGNGRSPPESSGEEDPPEQGGDDPEPLVDTEDDEGNISSEQGGNSEPPADEPSPPEDASPAPPEATPQGDSGAAEVVEESPAPEELQAESAEPATGKLGGIISSHKTPKQSGKGETDFLTFDS
jgi:hypothetical protein